jgi:Lecithin retinol acyltransferase
MIAVHFKLNSFIDLLTRGRSRVEDAPISRLERPPYREPRDIEGRLVPEWELPLASHVITPRRGYLHHGIYVGNGQVVHYTGLAHGLRRGPVEEVSLARFTRGHPVWVRSNGPSTFDCLEIIRRARSRVGEDSYRLLSNNCEHFCEWCLRGENRSYQVEAWLAHPGRALLRILRVDGQCQRLRGSDIDLRKST